MSETTEAKRLFVVELRTAAIVLAANSEEAYQVAVDNQRDILRDTADMQIDVLNEVKEPKDATVHGWDDKCYPYGGEEDKTVGELLKEIADTPEPATRCEHTKELPL
jgi:hypothetical protein